MKGLIGLFILFVVFGIIVDYITRTVRRIRQSKAERILAEQQRQQAIEQEAIAKREALEYLKTLADGYGDKETVRQIETGAYDGPLPKWYGGTWTNPYETVMEVPIAGINHRKGIRACVGESPVRLFPEPDNEYDPDAIRIVNIDGIHVGYVPKDMTAQVRAFCGSLPYDGMCYISEEKEDFSTTTFFVGTLYLTGIDVNKLSHQIVNT